MVSAAPVILQGAVASSGGSGGSGRPGAGAGAMKKSQSRLAGEEEEDLTDINEDPNAKALDRALETSFGTEDIVFE